MVTKLQDNRGQVTIKAHAVTDEWEALVKKASQRNGQTVADFIVSITTEAAQTILKGGSAVPAALPARPEDLIDAAATRAAELAAAGIAERLAEMQRRQDEMTAGYRMGRLRRWRGR